MQTSVTLHAVHNGIGQQEDLLVPDDADAGLKVRLLLFLCFVEMMFKQLTVR